jgi:hypothetical protein
MTPDSLQVSLLVEPQGCLQIESAVVVVPEQGVDGAGTEHALTIVVGTSPDLVHDVLGKRMVNQFYQIVVVNHVQGISVV